MKLRVILVEDDKLQSDALYNILNFLPQEIEVIGVVNSIDSASNLIYDSSPDIVFLDIELNNIRNENGLNLLKKIYKHKHVPYIAIFTNYFKKYSELIANKKSEFIDKEIYYLEKPYDIERINVILNLIVNRIKTDHSRMLSVKLKRDQVIFIPCHDIISLSRWEDKYSRIVYFNGTNIEEHRYPGEFTEEVRKLNELKGFVYARKALIFNVYRIKKVLKSNGKLLVEFPYINNKFEKIKISETYLEEWRNKFNIKRY